MQCVVAIAIVHQQQRFYLIQNFSISHLPFFRQMKWNTMRTATVCDWGISFGVRTKSSVCALSLDSWYSKELDHRDNTRFLAFVNVMNEWMTVPRSTFCGRRWRTGYNKKKMHSREWDNTSISIKLHISGTHSYEFCMRNKIGMYV